MADDECACGCGEPVRSPRLYRQGHDAKHVSNLVNAVFYGRMTYDEASGQTTSAKLRDKFERDFARKRGR